MGSIDGALPVDKKRGCGLDAVLHELIACETRVWEALVAGDQAADSAMLHADFLGVYSDGFGDKGAHVAQLAGGPIVQSYEMTCCRVMLLGPEHAVLSYRATYLRAGHTVAEAMYVSSIWQRAGLTWVNVFSQDTAAVS